MLAREENELITRVGQGSPMGNTMRRYWIPALLAHAIGACLHLVAELLMRGQVGLIQAIAVDVEFPAVIDAT